MIRTERKLDIKSVRKLKVNSGGGSSDYKVRKTRTAEGVCDLCRTQLASGGTPPFHANCKCVEI